MYKLFPVIWGMKSIFLLLSFLSFQSALAQHVVVSGALIRGDTVMITVMNEGRVLSQTQTAAEVYSLFLGEHDFYTIRFETSGYEPKYLHFFTYNITKPTTIAQDVDFGNRVNMILWVEGRRGKAMKEIRTLWGAHARWKEF